MASHRVQYLNIDLSIVKLAADVASQPDVEVTGDFSGEHLCIEGEEFEAGEFGLKRGEEDLIDGGLDLRRGVLLIVNFCTYSAGRAQRTHQSSQESPYRLPHSHSNKSIQTYPKCEETFKSITYPPEFPSFSG